jgi:hypothetical protein
MVICGASSSILCIIKIKCSIAWFPEKDGENTDKRNGYSKEQKMK